MIYFFRKIRRGLIENKKIKTYMTYAIGEIILVVLGILIAISLNNLKDASKLKEDQRNLYRDMSTELKEDLRDIQENADHNNLNMARYRLGSEIILTDKNRERKEELVRIAFQLTQFSDFKNDRPIYDRLFSSNENQLINDSKIISDLKNLAVLYNYLNRLEMNQQDYMYTVLPKLADYIRRNPPEIIDLDALYGYRFQNDIEILIFLMEEKKQVYEDVENSINDLLNDFETKLR
jgi:uncharacterized membrane protein YgaE (UPF0421/DUF939 family)